MRAVIQRYGIGLTVFMIAVSAFWVLLLIVLPYSFMIDFSFRPALPLAKLGGPEDIYTFKNYATLWRNEPHFNVFWQTILGSAVVTAATLALCYPLAYVMALVTARERAALYLLMLIIPFWVNEILRTYAWYIIMSLQGPLNAMLLWLGIIDQPVRFISGNGSVLIGMMYAYILFMVLPLYNAMESLDRNQIEAARDLGASSLRTHWRVVIPHAKPGIAAGSVLTFMLAAGSIAVPSILSSPGSRWFTEIIYDWFFEGNNWNQGAAYAFILLILCMAFIFGMMAVFKVRLGDIAK